MRINERVEVYWSCWRWSWGTWHGEFYPVSWYSLGPLSIRHVRAKARGETVRP